VVHQHPLVEAVLQHPPAEVAHLLPLVEEVPPPLLEDLLLREEAGLQCLVEVDLEALLLLEAVLVEPQVVAEQEAERAGPSRQSQSLNLPKR